MKKIFFLISLLSISFSLFADSSGLSEARKLAEKGIIVDQSSMAAPYAGNASLDIVQESSMYRLSDELIRQEALGVALRLKGANLSDSYKCQNYFRDTSEWWVCRAAERAADFGLVTRANLYFRPHDTLTLAESLGIILNSLAISHSSTSTATISGTLPAWQKRLILTIQEQQITLNVRDDNGRGIAVYDPRIGSSISGFDMSHRLTRGQFFQIVVALLDFQESSDLTAHCTVYNDGCNDCIRGDEGIACTERACIWQGIPSCSECEAGYALENNRCIKKQTACIGLGSVVSNLSLPPEYQFNGVCCSGLTSVSPKEGGVGGSNICANIGDGYCDSRYESDYNSADCRTTVTFDDSICQSYYDGCNSCSKTSNGQTICTLMACFVNGPAYCTSYASYAPVNQSQDDIFLGKVLTEIQNYTKDLSCTSSSQCSWKLFGNSACGGSSIGIRYSSNNIDMTLLGTKTQFYTDAQKLYNQTYPVFGPCAIMTAPPPLSCVNGMCQ